MMRSTGVPLGPRSSGKNTPHPQIAALGDAKKHGVSAEIYTWRRNLAA